MSRTWLQRLTFRRDRATPALGQRGEDLAADHLKRHGYRILGRNLRSRIGEVDILAEAPDGRTIVVVEVKAGSSADNAFTPEMHVTIRKQRKLITLAAHLARRQHFTDRPIRFDVIAVDFPPGADPQLRHHPGAFTTG